MLRKTFLSTILAASLTYGVSAVYAAPASDSPSSQAFDNKIVKRINVDNIYNNIEYLSRTPRVAGSPEEYKAVQYIKSQFDKYGYETKIQPFDVFSYKEPTTISLSVSGFDDSYWQLGSFTYNVNGGISGELVDAGLGGPEDFAGKNLTGKIALIQRGSYTFADKIRNAAKAGAEAVIIYNNGSGVINGTLGGPDQGFVPALALTKEQGESLKAKLEEALKAGKTLTATVKVEGAETKKATSHNVIATKKASQTQKDTNQIVIVGAHHDSVEGGPGANDDASGTSTVLELARVMANMPTDTELRFVTFGAEENGLVGSYAYADSLSQDEIDRTVGEFQMDMIGSRDAGDLIMYTIDGEKNKVTDLGAAAGARLSGVVNYGQEGRSDHQPFYELGIPAALFIHTPVEPWYHTPQDTIDKISKEKLKQVADIVGAAVYQVARPDTPALEWARVAPKPVDYKFDDRPVE
jgi:aminopeptidase YwaD